MRFALVLIALVVTAAPPANALEGDDAKKEVPTEQAIIDLCGARLVKVFKQFGMPEDVFPTRGSSPDKDGVTLDYGAFGFNIKKKTVKICYFWSDWKEPVKGVKINDTREKVVQVLGKKYQTEKNEDGVDDYGWDLKDNDATLWVVFNKENKVKRIQVELK